jgi:predicted Ser/Thr protein kinase
MFIFLEKRRYLKDIVIKESIGTGQFGQVFRGVWQGSVQVALKTLRVEDDNAEFEKEIEILA